jgi:hypothetical protein
MGKPLTTMPHFLKRMETSEGFLNFYFNLINTSAEPYYHVSVVGKDQKVHVFSFQKKKGKWKLIKPKSCPQWFIPLEKECLKAITAHNETH